MLRALGKAACMKTLNVAALRSQEMKCVKCGTKERWERERHFDDHEGESSSVSRDSKSVSYVASLLLREIAATATLTATRRLLQRLVLHIVERRVRQLEEDH